MSACLPTLAARGSFRRSRREIAIEADVCGSIDTLFNARAVVELAVEQRATTILTPVSARRQLFDLSDDMAAKIEAVFYIDVRDALMKAVGE